MSTWAIGDVQGCYGALQALLARISYDPGRDRLWLTGDLVNRGGEDLKVLRWARSQEDRLTCVLGNHDLHLLGRALGVAKKKKHDTVDEVLAAPDCDELISWLRNRPLIHREGAFTLVHGGLLPAWSLESASALARDVERALRGSAAVELLTHRRDAPPWHAGQSGVARLQSALSVFVNLRCVDADGAPAYGFKGPPAQAPTGLRPWYEAGAAREGTLLFGHWATHGVLVRDDIIALDSGCVWGHALTAVRLEDRAVVSVDC